MTKYRCYFITIADKAETSYVIEADSPSRAADEAILRCADPAFVGLKVWDGSVRVLEKHLGCRQPAAFTASALGGA